jgi:hypothetical protein
LQHEEIAEGIAEWNIPGFQANRDLVAHPDGGLYNPIKHFTYPVLDDVKRPGNDDDLAFMTV